MDDFDSPPPTPKSADTSPPLDFDHKDVVKIIVGKHVLLAHASLIVRDSSFFRFAVKNSQISRVVRLPDELPFAVSHYLKYLYSGRLPFDAFKNRRADYFELIAELYILGQRLSDEQLRKAVLRELLRLQEHTGPVTEAVNVIYYSTTAGSRARRLLVDIYVTYGTDDWLDSSLDPGFVLDVAHAFCSKAQFNITPAQFRGFSLSAAVYGC